MYAQTPAVVCTLVWDPPRIFFVCLRTCSRTRPSDDEWHTRYHLCFHSFTARKHTTSTRQIHLPVPVRDDVREHVCVPVFSFALLPILYSECFCIFQFFLVFIILARCSLACNLHVLLVNILIFRTFMKYVNPRRCHARDETHAGWLSLPLNI